MQKNPEYKKYFFLNLCMEHIVEKLYCIISIYKNKDDKPLNRLINISKFWLFTVIAYIIANIKFKNIATVHKIYDKL